MKTARISPRTSLWICIALAVAPFLFFLPETLGRRAFYFNDVQNYFYPYRKAAADIVRAGHLPLWNPYTSGGLPLLGDGQTALLFPPNWLIFIAPPVLALNWAIIACYSIAGVGMFLLGRQLRFDRQSATIGAIGFMFCGYLTAQVVHLSIMATLAMVPWIFWAFERVLERRSIGSIFAAALIVAMQVVAGHPQVPTYTGVALLGYALVIATPRLLRDRREAIWPFIALASMYVGGTLLAAIQLLPWFEAAKLSPRAAGTSFELFVSNSVAGHDWWLLLFPFGYGGMQTSWMQSVGEVNFTLAMVAWERSPYVGIVPLVLAIVGISQWRRSSRVGAIVAMLVAMLLIAAVGSVPFARIIHAIPVLGQFRANARALGLVAFAINLLAMFGASRLIESRRRIEPVAMIAGLLVLLTIATTVVIANSRGIDTSDPRGERLWELALKLPNHNVLVPLCLAIATAIVFCLPIRNAQVKLLALAAILTIDLAGLARAYNLTVPASEFATRSGAAEFLKSDPEPFRVAVFTASDIPSPATAIPALSVSWTMAFGIEDINTYNSLQPRRCVDYLVSAKHPDVLYGLLTRQRLQPPYDRAMVPLNVKYAIVQKRRAWTAPDGWTRVYEDEFCEILRSPHPTARGFFAEFVKPASDPREVLAEMRGSGFDALKVALVEGDLSAEAARELWIGAPGAELQRTSFSPNQQTWRTRTTSTKLLVLSEMFFPGWRAAYRKAGSSDAWQSLPIYRTNYLFRGIPVPAGDNEIRIMYRPTSVIVGAIATFVMLLGGAVTLFIARSRRARVPE